MATRLGHRPIPSRGLPRLLFRHDRTDHRKLARHSTALCQGVTSAVFRLWRRRAFARPIVPCRELLVVRPRWRYAFGPTLHRRSDINETHAMGWAVRGRGGVCWRSECSTGCSADGESRERDAEVAVATVREKHGRCRRGYAGGEIFL